MIYKSVENALLWKFKRDSKGGTGRKVKKMGGGGGQYFCFSFKEMGIWGQSHGFKAKPWVCGLLGEGLGAAAWH